MKFTLVIPVAPERNAEIIESIKKLDYSKSEFHVVIVRGKNASENRNKGFEKARGEIIGFLDDDGIIEEDFLKQVDKFFYKYPWIDIVGGPQLTPKDEKGFAKISGYALASKFGASGVSKRYKKSELNLDADEKSLTSANLFVRKNVMDKIKFDENLWPGEDPKFIDDAKKSEFKIAYCPDFVIYHRRRPNVKGIIKQIFNYGKVRPKKESFIETLKKPIFLIPSLFVVYLIILMGSILINPSITGQVINLGNTSTKGGILFYPLMVYIFLSVLFGIYDSINNKNYKAIFILPFIYPIIHLSYGIGMIYGMVKKSQYSLKSSYRNLKVAVCQKISKSRILNFPNTLHTKVWSFGSI